VAIRSRIADLSDLQVRRLIARVCALSNMSGVDSDLDNNLQSALNYWSEIGANKTKFSVKDVRDTMGIVHDYFAQNGLTKTSLEPNSPLANYISSFVESNPWESAQAMLSFVRCACVASKKSHERQEIFLETFPPSAEYMKCLDGTKERLEQLEREIASKRNIQPFMNAHSVTILRAVDTLRHKISLGNEVHLPKYLEYSLGLRSDKVIHPQSQIPFCLASSKHSSYAEILKDNLCREILEDVATYRAEINAEVALLEEVFSNLDGFDPVATEPRTQINKILEKFEFGGKGFIAGNEGDDNAHLDRVRLAQAAYHTPALRWLNKEIEKLGTAPVQQNSVQFLRLKNDSKIFFTEQGISDMAYLLKHPENADEFLFAFENLWMLGGGLASNSPYIFSRIIAEVNSGAANYLSQVVQPRITELVPNHAEKSELVVSSSEFLIANIDSFDNADALNSALQVGSSDQNSVDQYYAFCRRLILRPDATEIFDLIKRKLGAANLYPTFLKFCLQGAAEKAEPALCTKIFTDFVNQINIRRVFTGNYALHCAMNRNDVELTRLLTAELFTHGAILLNQQLNGTPVALAASLGSAEALKAFCNVVGVQNAQIEQMDGNNMGLVHLAARNNHSNVLLLLKSLGADLTKVGGNKSDSPTHYAVSGGHAGVIETLYECYRERGLTPEQIVDAMNQKNSDKVSPLELAVMNGNKDCILALAKAGVTGDKVVNCINDDGKALIHLAILHSKSHLISSLHELGANLDLPCDGKIPLVMALERFDSTAISEFKKSGMDLDLEDDSGHTMLYRVRTNMNLVRALIDGGVDVNYRNANGNTALHLAALNVSSQLFNELRKLGAKLDVVNDDGETPDYIAVKNGLVTVIHNLSNNRIKFLAQCAIERDDKEMIKKLIAHEKEVVNEYARSLGKTKMADFLQSTSLPIPPKQKEEEGKEDEISSLNPPLPPSTNPEISATSNITGVANDNNKNDNSRK